MLFPALNYTNTPGSFYSRIIASTVNMGGNNS